MSRRVLAFASSLAILISALGASPVAADGSTTCASNGSFYSRVGAIGQGATPVVEVQATLEESTLNRCNGTDPDGKNGAFVYIELLHPSYLDHYFVYDQGQASLYGDYVRLGYYLCSWSGDTACNQGHGWFIAWGRRAGSVNCTSSDANGIHRLDNFIFDGGGQLATVRLTVQPDGSVQAFITTLFAFTVPASAVGCWSRSTAIQGRAMATAWDPGDRIAGSATARTTISNLNLNRQFPIPASTCISTSNGPYRCADVGTADIDLWTIDR